MEIEQQAGVKKRLLPDLHGAVPLSTAPCKRRRKLIVRVNPTQKKQIEVRTSRTAASQRPQIFWTHSGASPTTKTNEWE
jgi:hypothetical protein